MTWIPINESSPMPKDGSLVWVTFGSDYPVVRKAVFTRNKWLSYPPLAGGAPLTCVTAWQEMQKPEPYREIEKERS